MKAGSVNINDVPALAGNFSQLQDHTTHYIVPDGCKVNAYVFRSYFPAFHPTLKVWHDATGLVYNVSVEFGKYDPSLPPK